MKRSVNIDTIQEEVNSSKPCVFPALSNLVHLPNKLSEKTEECDEIDREKATVLLVDDEVQTLRGLSRVLRHQPYCFYTVRSADEAIEVLQRQAVDVVVTDEMMPGMSGTELAAWIAQSHPEVKTIILTGHPDAEIAIRAINQGHVFRFFTKPCSAFDLVLAIHEAVDAE